MYDVYCAGPMGGPDDFAAMRELSRRLREAGYSTFTPVDDGFPLLEIFGQMEAAGWSRHRQAEAKYYLMAAVFALDVFNVLANSRILVANLCPFERCSVNPDSGTIVELSLACAFGKPVIAYKTDAVRYFPVGSTIRDGWDNPMTVGLLGNFYLGAGGYVATDYSELIRRLEALGADVGPVSLDKAPPTIAAAVALGRNVQRLMPARAGSGPGACRLKSVEAIVRFVRDSSARFGVAPWNGVVPPSNHYRTFSPQPDRS